MIMNPTVDARAQMLSSRQGCSARRRANRGAGIEVREPHALGGQAVERRCVDRAAVGTDVLEAQIVGQ